MEDNRLLRLGMTCYDGKLTLKETALKQNREWTDATSWSRSGKTPFPLFDNQFPLLLITRGAPVSDPDAGAGNPRRSRKPVIYPIRKQHKQQHEKRNNLKT